MIGWKNEENRCVSTLGCHERQLCDILEMCRRYGIKKLEIRGIGGELDNRRIGCFSDGEIAETLAKFDHYGVKPYILGTSCKFDDDKSAEKAADEGVHAIALARRLGCSGIRIFGNRIVGDTSAAVSRLIRGVGQLCDAAAGFPPVSVLLETHGDYISAATIRPVADALAGCDSFGLIWDIAHTDAPYGGDFLAFYREFRPLIRHVHIKDSASGRLCLPGDGTLPVGDICAHMLSDGYTGAFSLEWERKWHPELPPIEKAMEKLL